MTFWQALLALWIFLLSLHYLGGAALLPAIVVGIVGILASIAVLVGK